MVNGENQGYEADHKDIKLLRLKNFTIGRKLNDSEITSADSLQHIADLIGSMVPFVSFCRLFSCPLLHGFSEVTEYCRIFANLCALEYRSHI